MSKDPRKEELKRAFKQRERQTLIDSIPISHHDLRDLFNPPDWGGLECDHTFRETIAFLEARDLDVERVTTCICVYGGFCDCEVIYNVDEKFGEIVGR